MTGVVRGSISHNPLALAVGVLNLDGLKLIKSGWYEGRGEYLEMRRKGNAILESRLAREERRKHKGTISQIQGFCPTINGWVLHVIDELQAKIRDSTHTTTQPTQPPSFARSRTCTKARERIRDSTRIAVGTSVTLVQSVV